MTQHSARLVASERIGEGVQAQGGAREPNEGGDPEEKSDERKVRAARKSAARTGATSTPLIRTKSTAAKLGSCLTALSACSSAE